MQQTQILAADDAGITCAAELLSAGQLVALPTETVYGLGGDARNDRAVAQIYQAKGRPSFNPLIAHVADIETAEKYVHFNEMAYEVARAFWPGPITLVLPLREDAGISPLVTAGLATLAVRIPAHPVARRLLRAFGGPVAAPSANPSGRVSPTRAQHVADGLSGRIAAVIDGGACAVGVESTILGLAHSPKEAPLLLRPGGVATEDIEALLGLKLQTGGDAAKPSAPGQLLSHYAPGAFVRLNAITAEPDEVLVGFGAVAGDLSLSPSGDLLEAAAQLFHLLREADILAQNRVASFGPQGDDRQGKIAFAPIPETGLGQAINDRLRRAAAPRP